MLNVCKFDTNSFNSNLVHLYKVHQILIFHIFFHWGIFWKKSFPLGHQQLWTLWCGRAGLPSVSALLLWSVGLWNKNKKNLHLWSSRAQNTKDWYDDVLYSAYVQYSKGSWSWTVLVHIQILILDNFLTLERCSKIFTYNFLCEISQTCHQLQ